MKSFVIRYQSVLTTFLIILFVLVMLEQFSTLKTILDDMSTTGKQFPLQTFLGKLALIWRITDTILETVLGSFLFYHLFRNYAWGGFTFSVIIWSLILYIRNINSPGAILQSHEISQQLKNGQRLIISYMIFFVITILYGLNRDNWVPYVQEPTWVINLAHKQQISAGTFFIVYYIIWVFSYFPHLNGHVGAKKFLQNPKLLTYTFIFMNLDNLASFSWFPGPIDPNNNYIMGYEEIFQNGQTWTSTDKIFHFGMSSVAILILLMFVKNTNKAILISIGLVVFWELFEISLNPKEASDSLLDMTINSIAIILSAIIYRRNEKSDLSEV